MNASPQGSGDAGDPSWQLFAQFWADYLRRVDESTRALLSQPATGGEERRESQAWLDAMSRCLDEFLRSPLFLGAMREHIAALVRARRKPPDDSNSAASPEDSNCPPPDPSAWGDLLVRLQQANRLVEERLSAVDQRMEALQRDLPPKDSSDS